MDELLAAVLYISSTNRRRGQQVFESKRTSSACCSHHDDEEKVGRLCARINLYQRHELMVRSGLKLDPYNLDNRLLRSLFIFNSTFSEHIMAAPLPACLFDRKRGRSRRTGSRKSSPN